MKIAAFIINLLVLKAFSYFILILFYSNIVSAQKPDTSTINEPIVSSECIEFPKVVASFPGGKEAMNAWVKKEIQYPEIAYENEDQGTALVSFVIEPDGSLSNVSIVRPLTRELDREAKWLIQSMPKWIPGESGGKKVRTRVQLPIYFILY